MAALHRIEAGMITADDIRNRRIIDHESRRNACRWAGGGKCRRL